MTHAAKSDAARNVLTEMVRRGTMPGIQYVVVSSDRTLFEACHGVKDVASDDPITPDTTFMASSVTKTLTAAAVLQLQEKGELGLSDSLGSHFPDHPFGAEVRLSHLLNQSSGIPNPMPLKWLHLASERERFDEDAALRHALSRHKRLSFSPGEQYAYSNLSYWLLGKVVECVGGTSYAKYMREQIFSPLGISEGEMSCFIPDMERHARGHVKRWSMLGMLMPMLMYREHVDATESGRKRFKPLLMNGPAYGGLVGTARAFGIFLQDQLRNEPVIFGAATKRLFFSEQKDRAGRAMPTTLGWHRGDLNGVNYYGKPGGGPGFQSNIRLYPDRGVASAWLANEAAASEGPMNAVSDTVDKCFL